MPAIAVPEKSGLKLSVQMEVSRRILLRITNVTQKKQCRLRYYIFKPIDQSVFFYTYSPITGSFEQDYNSQGSFEIKMKYDSITNVNTRTWSSIKIR